MKGSCPVHIQSVIAKAKDGSNNVFKQSSSSKIKTNHEKPPVETATSMDPTFYKSPDKYDIEMKYQDLTLKKHSKYNRDYFKTSHLESKFITPRVLNDITCNEGESLLEFEVRTSSRPSDTSWNLKNTQSNQIVWSGGSYINAYTVYHHSKCIYSEESYLFTLLDSNGEFTTSQYYKLTIDGKDIKYTIGKLSFFADETVLCSKDEDCDDSKSCTIDTCSIQRKQCRHEIPTTSCNECGKLHLSIQVKTDLWPSEVGWKLERVTSSGYINLRETIAEKFGYSRKNYPYEHNICIDDISHEFNVYTSAGYFSPDKFIQLTLDDVVIRNFTGEDRFRKKETILCTKDMDCDDDKICTIDTCDVSKRQCSYSIDRSNKNCGKFGNPKVLAVRVISPDANTTLSSEDLSDKLFGTGGKNFTMRSQFMHCSFNQFNPVAYEGITNDGRYISNGVVNVKIEKNVTDESTGIIQDLVIEELEKIMNNTKSEADFVMIFLPPGTKLSGSLDWKAYAFLNHYISVFNEEFPK